MVLCLDNILQMGDPMGSFARSWIQDTKGRCKKELSIHALCHLSCVPKKDDPYNPTKILHGMLGRPQYISET
ncbi:MAG: hypothetical protein H6R44_85, partial [Nitrospirae bacterium]|nr:hypothetical protein [Nitrospirota bacterium]